MTQPALPTIEATPDRILAGRIVKQLRQFADAHRKQEDTDLLNKLQAGIQNLLDPPEDETAKEEAGQNALLALAERYYDNKDHPDPKNYSRRCARLWA